MIEEVKSLVARYSDSLPDPLEVRANCAVLVPLSDEGGRVLITFIRRAEDLGLHRGQMGFPGGMAEAQDDGSLLSTALRESREEIGLEPEDVSIAGRLSVQSTIRTGLLVQPFVGVFSLSRGLSPHPPEVQSVHTVDLEEMASGVLGPSNPFGLQPPVYPVEGLPVWGLTAKIVKELTEVLRTILAG